MPTRVAIVPHTHWDREWYSPFQTFRLRLVRLLDALLPMLESDLSYSRFLLDGQTAVLDDYLAVRPEAAPALARLASSGRLAIGPWMVLMDEFMVSGETIVRDLQLGIARGAELGGVMDVGYLPDMFGHVAQMPQVLRLAGFEHAVVWRGVPAMVEHTAFWWDAPDGSRVRAEYLFGSYSNGRDIPDDAKRLVLRAVDYEQELGTARLGDMLLMNGTDHQMPQPWLGRVVAEANAMQDEYEFVVTSLPEYLALQPTTALTTVHGELRSGARANLLMGVGSNRVDVHRACAAAERALEKRAEPLSALLLPAAQYPHAFATIAWRDLMRGTEFQGRDIAAYEVRDNGDRHDIELREATAGEVRCDLAELKQQMLALGDAGREMRIHLIEAPGRRVLFDTGEIPGFGWSCFTASDGASPAGTVRALENEHLRVEVDPADGTYTIETADGLRVSGLGRLVDGGDGGDTYNYSPPASDVVIDRPESVTVTTTEDGPVRARVVVDAVYALPSGAIGDWRACDCRSHD